MSWKEFLYFQKSDRRVLTVIVVVVAVALSVSYLVGGGKDTTIVTEEDSIAVAPVGYGGYNSTRHRQWKGQKRGYTPRPPKYYQVEGRVAELFEFDPNTADSTQLLRLGLQPWQVRNIYRYRAKGGVYRQPEDFARLYGLTVKQYKELEPYIRISGEYAPAATLVPEREAYVRDTLARPVKLQPGEHITLNGADTTMLKKVPGVGSGFARRIIRYGQQLGGYYSVEQLREIEGFPVDAIPYFVIGDIRLRKINVNKMSVNEMKQHPYLSFYQARAIEDYRRLNGPLKSLDDLRLHKDFPPEAIERLSPYVEF